MAPSLIRKTPCCDRTVRDTPFYQVAGRVMHRTCSACRQKFRVEIVPVNAAGRRTYVQTWTPVESPLLKWRNKCPGLYTAKHNGGEFRISRDYDADRRSWDVTVPGERMAHDSYPTLAIAKANCEGQAQDEAS